MPKPKRSFSKLSQLYNFLRLATTMLESVVTGRKGLGTEDKTDNNQHPPFLL